MFHHGTHTHPFVAPFSGATGGNFTIPNTGETATDVWYRVHLTVRDSGGLTHTVTRDILPNTATLNSRDQSRRPGPDPRRAAPRERRPPSAASSACSA